MNANKSLSHVPIFALAAILWIGVLQCRDADARAVKSKAGADSQISPLSDPGSGKTCSKVPSIPAAQELGLKRVLIFLNTEDQSSFETVGSKVRELGGKVTVSMAPKSLFAIIPPEAESAIRTLPEVKLISSIPSAPEKAPGLSGVQKKLLDGWNRSLTGSRERTLTSPTPLIHDAKTRPLLYPAAIKNQAPNEIPSDSSASPDSQFPAPGAQIEYEPVTTMANTVAVAVFFPESNGAIDLNRENWTQDQINNSLAKIAAAFDWWAANAPVGQNLSFDLYITYTPFNSSCAFTGFEPIKRPSEDEGLWIGQIMNCLGYGDDYYAANVDSFNAWLKTQANAKQAFSIFVVNDTTISNHIFTDGYFAYAYLGGPLMVMTYNNDHYGIENMDAVCAHETGHIFNAFDEYYQAGYQTCDCSETSQGCLNENCQHGCSQNVCCIMRGQVDPYVYNCICACTKGQIGWSCGNCGTQTCDFSFNSPTAGQTMLSGETVDITWTTIGGGCGNHISLYYYPNGYHVSGSDTVVVADSIPDTGSFVWTAPGATTNNGQITITDSVKKVLSEKFIISTCGNGVCDGSESYATCPQDCPNPNRCGNGVCDSSESSATCPQDCQNTNTSNSHPGGGCGIWMIKGSSPNGGELGVNLILLALPLAILFYLKSRSNKQARKNGQV